MNMNKIINRLCKKNLNALIVVWLVLMLMLVSVVEVGRQVLAASTTTLSQTINPGTLTVDIVDGSYNSVASPGVTMNAVTFSFSCQTSTGTLGTSTEKIYVQNPDAADNGWTLTIAPSTTTASLEAATAGTKDFDFNDDGGSGCTDGTDADTLAGQMTINPSGATLAVGQCANCTTTGITLGSSTAYVEGTTDSVTLLTAASTSDDIGDWTLTGVSISQTIPAEQPADTYTIDLTLTVTAS